METSTPRAISGSRPIVTNSVVPIAKPPTASAVVAHATRTAEQTGVSVDVAVVAVLTPGQVRRRRHYSLAVVAAGHRDRGEPRKRIGGPIERLPLAAHSGDELRTLDHRDSGARQQLAHGGRGTELPQPCAHDPGP